MARRPTQGFPAIGAALACAFLLGLGGCGNSTPVDGGGGGVSGGHSGTGGTANTGGAGGGAGAQGGAGGRGQSGGGSGSGVAGSNGAAGSGGVAGSGVAGSGMGGGSGGSGGGGRAGGPGGSGGGGRAGSGGAAGAGGGGHAGGGTNGGSGGSGAGTGGHAGATGSAGRGVDAGRDAPETGPFACNLIIGNSTTQQWFDGGFLTHAGIDATHWEMFFVAHHYIDSWANASDSGWTTPLDMGHACANGSTAPDRVIFIVTFAPPYPPEATYQTDLTSVANNIKAKYPGVKRIELMTLIRSPGNSDTACSSKANNEQAIPPAEDAGIAAVAALPAFAGLVFALPPAYVTACSDFVADAPQYTTAGATNIAGVYGAYYAAHP